MLTFSSPLPSLFLKLPLCKTTMLSPFGVTPPQRLRHPTASASAFTPRAPGATKISVPTSTGAPNAMAHTRYSCATDTGTQRRSPPMHPPPARSKISVTTPVSAQKLSRYLHGYYNQKFLVEGFSNGFFLHFEGPARELESTNSQSALQLPNIVSQKLQQEKLLGRIKGPSQNPPFPNFKSSPLALREKSEPGKYRLLHNLSYPYDENSVNYNIPQQSSTTHYSSVSDATDLIQSMGRHCYLAKSDIADAFRIVPIHPSQYHLTGFFWQGYYYDTCLPMGCSSSCAIFEQISSAIVWILANHFNIRNVVKVLDDFLFVAQTFSECQYMLSTFIAVCSDIGIPIAPHKTISPTTHLTFLGIALDTVAMEARLPQDKLSSYRADIFAVLQMEKITLRELKSLIGKLQFSTCIIPSGRPFLRRLHDLTVQARKPFHFIRLTNDTKQDLTTWIHFLQSFNGVTMIKPIHTSDSRSLHMHADASKWGFGATYGSNWLQCKWPESWACLDITVLELYPIFVLINIFGPKIANSKVIFHCDNLAIVHVINKQSSKSKPVMSVLRKLVLSLLHHKILLKAQHIPGSNNIICDYLSRQVAQSQKMLQFGMKPSPTSITTNLQPANFNWT